MRSVLLLCFVTMRLCAVSVVAQDQHSNISSTGVSLPTVSVEFTQDNSIPSIRVSPVLGFPMQCGGEGTVFLVQVEPPQLMQRDLYSVSAHGIHKYSLESVTDLYDVSFWGYYPTNSGVVVLLRATQTNEKTQSTLHLADGTTKESGMYSGEYHYYVATFDKDGDYKGSIPINDKLRVGNVGMFNSGTLLVSGIDQDTKKPVLALLDTNGSILRYLPLPHEIVKWNEDSTKAMTGRAPDQLGTVLGGIGSVPAFQFVGFGDKIIVSPIQSNVPIMVIDEGGGTNVVKVDLPEGQVIHSFVPSSEHWYVRVAPPGNSVDVRRDVVLYEIDSTSGKPKMKLLLQNVTSGEIACATGDEFLALKRNEKGQLVAMRGRVTH